MSYLLDANVFIQAKNLHYGLDFCPAFWDWLIEKNKLNEVFSIEKIGDKIDAGQDELSVWKSNGGPYSTNPFSLLLFLSPFFGNRRYPETDGRQQCKSGS
jgi:hypothetical protein